LPTTGSLAAGRRCALRSLGDDEVAGGIGDDRLYGDRGDDRLFGEAGDDV